MTITPGSRWWLAFARVPNPPSVSTTPWTHNGVTRPVTFNLDLNQPFSFVPNPVSGSDVFVVNNIGPTGDPWYAQMFVEEEVQNAQGQWVSTGLWSASRGTRMGILP
jgi:hypothetical protein